MIDLAATALGTRVVVRYRLPDGRATDALGYLRQADETTCVVETKRGFETIHYVDVVASKPVPPPPVRPARSTP